MNVRSILAVLAASVALSTGIGYAFGAASEPNYAASADATASANTSKQLKRMQQDIDAIQASTTRIGEPGNVTSTSLFGVLDEVDDDLGRICTATGVTGGC